MEISAQAALSPGVHWTVRRVGPRFSLDVVVKRKIFASAKNKNPAHSLFIILNEQITCYQQETKLLGL
jgi:hypothetical protein